MQTGVSRSDALRESGRAHRVEDIYSLVAMLIQTDKLGSSVAASLRAHATRCGPDGGSAPSRWRARRASSSRSARVPDLPGPVVTILGPAGIQLMKALVSNGQ